MKRYTLPELLSGAKNGLVTLDSDYVLYSDLIAAGCLVPVPVGEACELNQLLFNATFCCDRKIWRVVDPFVKQKTACIEIVNGEAKLFDGNTIVQPVRLVPLAELQ